MGFSPVRAGFANHAGETLSGKFHTSGGRDFPPLEHPFHALERKPAQGSVQ